MGFAEVMSLPARLFYLYLDGLSLKSRWMQAMAADYTARKSPETPTPTGTGEPGGRVIRDRAEAKSLLFDQWR